MLSQTFGYLISVFTICLIPVTEIASARLIEPISKEGYSENQIKTIKQYASYSRDLPLIVTSMVSSILNISFITFTGEISREEVIFLIFTFTTFFIFCLLFYVFDA